MEQIALGLAQSYCRRLRLHQVLVKEGHQTHGRFAFDRLQADEQALRVSDQAG
ncbi:hypothetical protein [Chloroflexus sp.]|uniref:hypothetical protein n=1 Tax=Chloroflexus sp. TaxID=1904827 RepID=UPI002ADE1858|nr:hypothetical protein [Chloroflexus sp.]